MWYHQRRPIKALVKGGSTSGGEDSVMHLSQTTDDDFCQGEVLRLRWQGHAGHGIVPAARSCRFTLSWGARRHPIHAERSFSPLSERRVVQQQRQHSQLPFRRVSVKFLQISVSQIGRKSRFFAIFSK